MAAIGGLLETFFVYVVVIVVPSLHGSSMRAFGRRADFCAIAVVVVDVVFPATEKQMF